MSAARMINKKGKNVATALVLRVCGPNGESHGGFRWPLTVGAKVAAPDWNPRAECGNGLHGWLYGAGDISAATIVKGAVWLVVEVEESTIIMIDGKCKYPRGVVRFVGAMHEAAAYLIANEPRAASCAVIGAVLNVAAGGSGQVGAMGSICGGDRAKMIGGYGATMTGSHFATMTGGGDAKITGGDDAKMTGSHFATMTGGYRATMIGGYGATMTGGHRATITGGCGATMTGGDGATMCFQWYDGKRTRITVGYVGEDGIEANVAYRCDDAGKLVRA